MSENKTSIFSSKSINDFMVCPKCNSLNCEEYSTDETEFSGDNTGHYFVDCRCYDCMTTFRLCMRFKYEITDAYIR